MRSAISLDILEESTISAVAKHLGLTDSLRDLRSVVEKQGDELAALLVILEETYRRFDVLIRQLQVSAHFLLIFVQSALYLELFAYFGMGPIIIA